MDCMTVMGISSGRTSVMMLMESVLAFEVGAAASRIFSSAIMYCGSDGSIACNDKRENNKEMLNFVYVKINI